MKAKCFKSIWICAVALLLNIAILMSFEAVSFAAEPPQIIVLQQDAVIERKPNEMLFDLDTVYSIDFGSHREADINKIIGVSCGDEEILIDRENKIAFKDDDYLISIILISSVNAFTPVRQDINFSLRVKAPDFRNKEEFENVKHLTLQKNQSMINLSTLYRLDYNSFLDTNVAITYSVDYPGRDINVYGDYIPAIIGIYTVKIKVSPLNTTEFEAFESLPLTVIAEKAKPSVIFQYDGIMGKEPIKDNKHTVYFMNSAAPINLASLYTIYENAYVVNEFNSNLIVKKKLGDKLENVQVFGSEIASAEGEYTVVVKINPNIQGAFSPVTSDVLNLSIKRLPPSLVVHATEVDMKNLEKKTVNLNDYISNSAGAYQKSDYTFVYKVTSGDKEIECTDGKIKAKKGEYSVKVIIVPTNNQFEEIQGEFALTITNTAFPVGLSIGLSIGGIVVVGGCVAMIFVLRLKKKKLVSKK